MPTLIKPFLYVIAFRPIAVLFAGAIGLVCWLLIMCVRAIAWLPTTGQRPRNSANLPRLGVEQALPPLCGFAHTLNRHRGKGQQKVTVDTSTSTRAVRPSSATSRAGRSLHHKPDLGDMQAGPMVE